MKAKYMKTYKPENLEADEEDGITTPFYLHTDKCEGGCDYSCNGDEGFEQAKEIAEGERVPAKAPSHPFK